ncbi:MAG TPA: hypothetical protein VN709_08445 [Terriglobales bacterium]|nr:hypothetical protein [Terriglobales bacterium]
MVSRRCDMTMLTGRGPSSLVPHSAATVLFTNAVMNQLKEVFPSFRVP